MEKFISGANTALMEMISNETALYCDPDEDRTVQSDAEDADINVLARRFGLTIDHPMDPSLYGHFGDFSELPMDYHEARMLVDAADEAFASLPSAVRERFGNDPGALASFVADGRNVDEAIELGLLTPEAAQRYIKSKPAKETDSDPVPSSGGE